MILIGRGLDLKARWFVKEAERSESRRQKRERSEKEECRNEWKYSLGQTVACAVLRVWKDGRVKRSERNPPEQIPNISGDNSLRDPPVPIPNTEVKPQHADSTWLETAR